MLSFSNHKQMSACVEVKAKFPNAEYKLVFQILAFLSVNKKKMNLYTSKHYIRKKEYKSLNNLSLM